MRKGKELRTVSSSRRRCHKFENELVLIALITLTLDFIFTFLFFSVLREYFFIFSIEMVFDLLLTLNLFIHSAFRFVFLGLLTTATCINVYMHIY